MDAARSYQVSPPSFPSEDGPLTGSCRQIAVKPVASGLGGLHLAWQSELRGITRAAGRLGSAFKLVGIIHADGCNVYDCVLNSDKLATSL